GFLCRGGGVMLSRMPLVALENWEQQLRDALAANDLEQLRRLLDEQHPADIADIVERLDEDDQLVLFEQLPLQVSADVLSELGTHATRELVSNLELAHVGDLLDQLPRDEAVEILTEDLPDLQQELLAKMEPVEAASVRDLLQYPPQSAGRLMTER